MSMKEAQEKLVKNMESWQKIENAAVEATGEIAKQTENPVIKLVMEIIQRDSQMHHRVQKFISDSMTTKAVTLNPDELASVWTAIEKHIALEEKTVVLAKDSLEATGGNKGMLIQHYLLEYLLADEQKHDQILDKLEAIKKGMYPYA